MRAIEEIIKMAKENNGTVTTAMVVAAVFLVEISNTLLTGGDLKSP